MTKERFNELVDYMIEKSGKTLKEKNAKYAPDNDALHNFHYGAQMDNSTTAQTIWHYWKKHLVALIDKISRDDWEDIDDVEEKIQDSINYLLFIWCAANEKAVTNESTEEIAQSNNLDIKKIVCNDCKCSTAAGCTLAEAPCSCCQYFDAMVSRPDDKPLPICARCKNYYIPNCKEWNGASYNFVRNCGHDCETCKHWEKDPSEFPCSECKYNWIIGSKEYEEAPDFWVTNN